VADNPQETVRELRELVIAYAKQEATEPLSGLKRFAALGLAGALLMGTGIFFLSIGALRAMQQYGGRFARGNFTWVPYFVVVIVLALLAWLVWSVRSRRERHTQRRSAA
jgi:membrane protein implicated in regulation of membrane protease activity